MTGTNPRGVDPNDEAAVLTFVKRLVGARGYRLSEHAVGERLEEGITTKEMEQAVVAGEILENYPGANRGPCCLIGGRTGAGRDLHVVLTTTLRPAVIITVYEPKEPRWITPTTRGPRRRADG